jgi:Protein of unknown function (DUF3223)
MKKPSALDGVVYPGRAELKAAVQEYVRTAPLDTPLWDGLPYAVFYRHPHREEKTGYGLLPLRHIEVRLTEYGNRGFYAVRMDGSVIDFSWRVALNFANSGPTLAAAAREAIYGQIAMVSARDPSMHVHHDGKPFQQLLNEWMARRDGRMPELVHGDTHDYFRDPRDAQSWREYHARHAVLKLVPVEEHKKLHRRTSNE